MLSWRDDGASMLLMAAACAMHVITLTLIRADTLLR
jgi:hypothetical protein